MGDQGLEMGEPVVVGNVVIRPIARRRVLEANEGEVSGVVARLRPLGVVVEGPDGFQTLDLDGEKLADDVIDELPHHRPDGSTSS